MLRLFALLLLLCAGLASANAQSSLVVTAWAGDVEDAFDAQLYPWINSKLVINIDSRAYDPSHPLVWFSATNAATSKNQAITDTALVDEEFLLRGRDIGMWESLDLSIISHARDIPTTSYSTDQYGNVDNVEAFHQLYGLALSAASDIAVDDQTSWRLLWDQDWQGRLALPAHADGGLLEITAAAWFGGQDVLNSRVGRLKVLSKIAELSNQVSLWYSSDSELLDAMAREDIDVGLMPTRFATSDMSVSIPVEGALVRRAFWVMHRASENDQAAQEFIDMMAGIKAQNMIEAALGFNHIRSSYDDMAMIEFGAALHHTDGEWIDAEYAQIMSQ